MYGYNWTARGQARAYVQRRLFYLFTVKIKGLCKVTP